MFLSGIWRSERNGVILILHKAGYLSIEYVSGHLGSLLFLKISIKLPHCIEAALFEEKRTKRSITKALTEMQGRLCDGLGENAQ